MYSRNDYRYYLERRLIESDDFLAHYGVKGMKWKNHKKKVQDIVQLSNNKINSVGELVNSKANDAGQFAKKTGKTINKKAKKAYKYADDHVDRYSFSYTEGDKHNRVYNKGKNKGKPVTHKTKGAGVLLKTKNRDYGVGVQAGETNEGKSKIGVHRYHDKKKKRKVKYTEAGISTKNGGSYYVKRANGKY